MWSFVVQNHQPHTRWPDNLFSNHFNKANIQFASGQFGREVARDFSSFRLVNVEKETFLSKFEVKHFIQCLSERLFRSKWTNTTWQMTKITKLRTSRRWMAVVLAGDWAALKEGKISLTFPLILHRWIHHLRLSVRLSKWSACKWKMILLHFLNFCWLSTWLCSPSNDFLAQSDTNTHTHTHKDQGHTVRKKWILNLQGYPRSSFDDVHSFRQVP